MISVLLCANAAMCAACGMSGRSTGTACAAHMFFAVNSTVTYSSSSALRRNRRW